MTSSDRASLWHHGDFLRLWTGQTISRFGSQISLLAIPLVAITLLDASAFEMGVLAAVEQLPFLVIALLAGAWADRLRKRPILVVGDLGRAIALGSIPLAWALGVLTMAQLYLVALVTGLLTVFFDVAWQSYLPLLVERDQIVDGNAKLQITESAASIAGPGLAGWLIGLLAAPLAILLDAASFVVSAAFVLVIRRREPHPAMVVGDAAKRRSIRAEIAEGLRYVLGQPYLRSIAASTAWSNAFSMMAWAIIVLYAYRELGLGPTAIGLVFAVGNVGGLVGAIAAPQVARRLGVGRAILVGMATGCPSVLLVALAPASAPIPFLVAAMLLAAFSAMVYNINQVSLRQAITPAPLLGRMNATMRFIVWGVQPIGALAGGFLGSAIGLSATIWVAALGSLFAFVPLLVGPLVSLREIPSLGPEAIALAEAEGRVEADLAARPEGPIA